MICVPLSSVAHANTGYHVTLTTPTTEVKCGEVIYVHIGVSEDFAAAELSVIYDSSKATFSPLDSSLGTPFFLEREPGVIKLVDFGENKPASKSNYILAFTTTEQGNLNISVTSAGFGTIESAEHSDLYRADVTDGKVTVKVVSKETPKQDNIFQSVFTFIKKLFSIRHKT